MTPVQVFYTFSSFFLVAHPPLVSDGAAFGGKVTEPSFKKLEPRTEMFLFKEYD